MMPTSFLVTVMVFPMMRLTPEDMVMQIWEDCAYADTREALRREGCLLISPAGLLLTGDVLKCQGRRNKQEIAQRPDHERGADAIG